MPREVRGFTDLGHIRVPFLPQYVVMTDRDDGTLWTLTHSEDGEYWAISDELPPVGSTEFHLYGPNAGPYVDGDGDLRLLVRGGRLGYEYGDRPGWLSGQSSAGEVQSRRRVQRLVNQIIRPVGWRDYGDVLGWERVYP